MICESRAVAVSISRCLLSHVSSDPSKARVLYDSKILECRTCKNKRPEYLVHFYGWNSSWDRCVPEENILKDTAENRQLQRQLAEAAAQGIRWKRVKLNKIPAIIREAVLSNSQDGHSSASDDGEEHPSGSPPDHEDIFENQKRSKSPTTSSLSSHQAKTFSQSSQDSCRLGPDIVTTTVTPAASEQLSWIAFPDNFKAILDADFESVTKKKERHRLPADTVISEILRDFRETVERGEVADLLPNFSRRSGVTRAFTQTNSRSFSDLQQLVDEFVNSVEIYVNSICSTHLFYDEHEKQEFTRHGAKGTECLGLVHLLRFLVVLPEFVQATNTITKHQVSHLTSILENFYFFLSKKQHLYLRS